MDEEMSTNDLEKESSSEDVEDRKRFIRVLITGILIGVFIGAIIAFSVIFAYSLKVKADTGERLQEISDEIKESLESKNSQDVVISNLNEEPLEVSSGVEENIESEVRNSNIQFVQVFVSDSEDERLNKGDKLTATFRISGESSKLNSEDLIFRIDSNEDSQVLSAISAGEPTEFNYLYSYLIKGKDFEEGFFSIGDLITVEMIFSGEVNLEDEILLKSIPKNSLVGMLAINIPEIKSSEATYIYP